MSKAVTTAKEINQAHQFAREHADTAIEWAITCGKLLAEKKAQLGHGKFEEWVEQWCEFKPRAARKYMQVAVQSKGQNGTAVPFSSMSECLGYDKPAAKSAPAKEPLTGAKADAGAGKEPVPAEAPKTTPAPIATKPDPAPVLSTDEPERPDDHGEDDAIAAAEAELAASIDKVMQADDKLAAAHAEIKRQAAEIATLKISRDGYMRGKEAVTKLLKAEQRKVAALERKFKVAA